MANSLKKQTQGDTMNLPPGIDRIELKDGTTHYRVRIRIKGHKPVSKNFKTLTHAKQWKRVTEGQIEEGLYLSFSKADQYTLSNAIDRYRKEILPHKAKDYKNVERHLNYWEKELGHLKLNHLTPSVITEAREHFLSEPIRGDKMRTGATSNRYTATLSHVLSTATTQWEWMHENPCLKVKKTKESRGRVRYLSKDELSRLLEACKQSKNPFLYIIFLISLTTGARRSEVLGLKGQDVHCEKGLLYLMDTKNGTNRAVQISEQIVNWLQARKLQNDLLLFPSPTNPNVPYDIRSAWEAAVKRAGIQDFRFHDIRHTTASYLAIEGFSMLDIAETLGHKSMQMTKRYSHLSNEHKRKLAQNIERIINEESQ